MKTSTMKKNEAKGFGQKLKALREKRAFTRAELATLAGYSLSSITMIETGHARPSGPGIVALARALKVEPVELRK